MPSAPLEAHLANVAIVVPTFKAGRYLVELCASLIAQTWPRFEVLILSDGCDDHLQPALQPYLADPRFRLLSWTPNRGVTVSTNRLLEEVRTPFWCYPGADDLLYPEFLVRRLEIMAGSPETSVIFGRGIQIDGEGKEIWYHPARVVSERLAILDGQRIEPGRMLSILLQDNVVNTPSIFLRSATTLPLLRKIDIPWRYAQDLHYWISLASHTSGFFYDHRVLHAYRIHSAQLSQNPSVEAVRLAEIRLVPLVALAQAARSSEVAAACWQRWCDDLYALWLWRVFSLSRRRALNWEWQSLATRARHGKKSGRMQLVLDLIRFFPRMVSLRWSAKKLGNRQIWVNGLRKIDDPLFKT